MFGSTTLFGPLLLALFLLQQLQLGASHSPLAGPASKQAYDLATDDGTSPAFRSLLHEVLAALDGERPLALSGTKLHRNFSYWQEFARSGQNSAEALLDQWGGETSSRLKEATFAGISTALSYADPDQLLASLRHGRGSQRPPDAKSGSTPGVAMDEKAVPGITAVVYQEFFIKASAVAVQLLQENFRKVRLDAVTTIAHVPVVGDFELQLENVRLEGLRLDQTTTGVVLGRGGSFELQVRGLDAVVDGHLRWRRTQFPFISGGCAAQVTAEGGEVRLEVVVVRDAGGRVQIRSIAAPRLSFSSIAIVTSQAKLAWLYNAVAALAKTPIQEAITNEVAAQVTTTVPAEVNRLLLGVPTTVEVKGLQLNTSLSRSPSVTEDRLIVWDWGRFQNPDGRWQECPFVRPAAGGDGGVLMPAGAPYMLVANLDESIANCLTWDLFNKGMLSHFFVGDDVPHKALYTDSWQLVIPAVYKRCPGCPMALNASVSAAPKTAFDPTNGIVSSGTAELSFFLAESGGSPGKPWTPVQPASRQLQAGAELAQGLGLGDHLFTLSLSGELLVPKLLLEPDVAANPDAWRLFLSMEVNKTALAVDVLESDVGPINKASLHLALTIAAFLVEDQVNHGILKDGFALPQIPYVAVTRANVTVGDAVLALGSDLKYAG